MNNKLHTLIVILISMIGQVALSQGILKGRITESTDANMGVAFANIILEGTEIGTTSDLDGYYQISAEAGTYSVQASFIGYNTCTQKGVVITDDAEKVVNLTMSESSMALDVLDLVVKADRESESAILVEQKNATEIVQAIGAKELSKKGASNVAEGVTKVVGISKSSSAKQIYVRGMGDRYNAALMNGLPIPSPNPDLKMVPLDLFPTKVVKQLSIMKTYSPRYYGDFGGAIVNIQTKDYPEEKFTQISASLGGNSLATGKSFMRSTNGALGFIGVKNSDAEVPNDIKTNSSYNSSNGNRTNPYKTGMSPFTTTALPKMNLGFSAGNTKETSNGGKVGYLTSINFRNNYKIKEGTLRNYNTQGQTKLKYDYSKYSYTTNTTGLVNLFWGINENHEISFNTLYVNDTEDSYNEFKGINLDNADFNIINTRGTQFRNNIWVNQILGKHDLLGSKYKLDWGIAYNLALSAEPNRVNLIYRENNPGEYSIFDLNDVDNNRFWSGLTDHEFAGRGRLDWNLEMDEDKNPLQILSFGFDAKFKERTFESWQANYVFNNSRNLTTENSDMDIHNPDKYFTDEALTNGLFDIKSLASTSVESKYFVESMIGGGYTQYDADLIPNILHLNAGIRGELSDVVVKYKQNGDLSSKPYREAKNDNLDILPALNLKYTLNETSNLRLAYGSSITRPKYKEIAPFVFKEFFGGFENQGNPELKNSANKNIDFKFETFRKPGEMFAATLFYKNISNPIERILKGGTVYTYTNTKEASVYGVELEGNINMANYINDPSNTLRNVKFGANVSYLVTEISAGNDNLLTNKSRKLQGAAPLLINADVNYTLKGKNSETNFALVYNFNSEKLFSAGIEGAGDRFVLSTNTLNLLVKHKIGDDWNLGLSLTNILNPNYSIIQKTNSSTTGLDSYGERLDGELLIDQYKLGLGFGISVSRNL